MPARKKRQVADNPLKWSRDDKLKLLRQYEAEEAAERAVELESKGWRVWYATIFGEGFVSNLAPHHEQALEWHWQTVLAKRAGLIPTPNSYFAVLPRGHRKSDLIRHIVVADACLLRKGYCLYVSSSRGKVHEHALSIEALIHSDGVAAYYPQLAKVDKTLTGQQRSWTADRMISEIGYTWHFVGLKEGIAGANVDGVRPSIVVLDDCDEREDSPMISEQRLKVLTRAVLATRQRNTVYFSAQNYISRHGIIYQIHTGKVPALSNRVHTEPIPAFYDLVTERRIIDGQPRDIIISGTPSWPYYDIDAGQKEIDDIGLAAFLVEMQHDVEGDKAGNVLPDYDEAVHVITWGAFNAVYNLPPENRDVPRHWRKFCGYDHGASEGHETAVSWLGVAGANGPLSGTIFFYKLMSAKVGDLSGAMAHRILDYVLAPLQADPATHMELGLLDRATADMSDVMASDIRRRITQFLVSRQDFAMFHASHEQKALRDVLRMIYALPFQQCNPKSAGGIEQWKHYMKPDFNEPHPFKPERQGLCKFYMIVDDDQEGTPRDDAGLAMARREIPEWRWRQQILTISGLMDERPAKQYDNVANCLVAGTLVKTEQGDVAIENVEVGQKVWTREGLKSVLWSDQTSSLEPVFDVELNNDTILTGTAHHPIWTDEGWTFLKCLREGDRLLAWQNPNLSSTAVSSFDAIQTLKAGAIVTTLHHTLLIISKALSSSMSRFGKTQMAQFLKAIVSTIKTRIRRITRWKILNALPKLSMLDITWPSALSHPNGLLSWQTFSLFLVLGTKHQKAGLGTDSTPKRFKTTQSLTNRCVNSVATVFGRSNGQTIALSNARGDSVTTSSVFVRQVKPSGEQPVYNLEVENQPEFFANGVLVHNSIQMILAHFSITATPLTSAERVEVAIPPHLRYDELLKNSPFEKGLTPEQEMAHLFAVAHAKKRAGKGRIQRFRDGERIG